MKKFLSTLITTIFLLSMLLASASIDANAQTPESPVLTVTGFVDHPTNLTLTQLKALPKTTEYAAIICVDFPSSIVEEGNWTGVQLNTLLEQAGIQSSAVKIVIAASDGYSSDLTVEGAMQSNVILAYEKDGEALSALRLVVPDRWGYKWVNFVSTIEVVNFDYLGFWESKGYSDSAIVGQDPGGSSVPISPPSSIPTTQVPSTTPTPSTTTIPTPTASPNSTIGTEATTPPTQPDTISKEGVYAVAIALVAAVVVAALVMRKKVKK